MIDLQDLLDDLAASLDRPVSLEDRRWRLIAHSAHEGRADDVRLASILARAAPPDVAAWLNSLDLDRGGELVDVPANSELGMVARLCAPVRHNDALFGYLWVIPGERSLADDERRTLTGAAGQAGLALWRRRVTEEQEQRVHGETLRTLLLDPAPDARRAAAVTLAGQQDWPPAAPFAVVVAHRADGEASSAAQLAEIARYARRRWSAGRLVWLLEAGRLVVVVVLGQDERSSLDAAMRMLRDAGADRVTAGAPRTELTEARAALNEAEAAARTVGAVPRLGPVARWDRLGSWAVVVEALEHGGAAAPAPIRRLLDQPAGVRLLDALEAALDHPGDMGTAAASLSMSRATLYRRLQRVEELTGLRLASGDDRLTLHLGLRLWRLAGEDDRGPAAG